LAEPEATGIDIVFTERLNGEEKVNADSLELNVVQSVELNAPLFVADAVGKLKVWIVPELEIPKSLPEVPLTKV
jgi:hypothetical protein